jgi:DNA repair exonuclease SbcCD ATPase subunit
MMELDTLVIDTGLKNAHRCIQDVDFLLSDIDYAGEHSTDVVEAKKVIIDRLEKIFQRVLNQAKVYDEVIIPIFEEQEETFLVDQEEVKEITSIRKLIASIYEDIPSGHAVIAEIKEAKDLEDVVEKATLSGYHFHGLIEGIYEEINIYIDKIIGMYTDR